MNSFGSNNKNQEDQEKIIQLRCYLNQILEDVMSYYNSTQYQLNGQRKSYKIKTSMIPAYTIVYELSIKKPSLQQKMFLEFKQHLYKYWTTFFQYKFNRDQKKTFVIQFNSLWQGYMMFTISISKRIFSYLDRYYLPATEEGSLFKISLRMFKQMLLISPHQNQFFDCYIHSLKNKRQQSMICGQDLLKFSEAIAIIDNGQLFQKLKIIYLIQAKRHYQQFIQKWKNSQNVLPQQYFLKVNNLSYLQKTLCYMSICFNQIQKQQLKKLFSTECIQKYSPIFFSVSAGFHKMFESKNVEYMRLVCKLYGKFSNFEQMRSIYYKYVLQNGQKLIIAQNSSERPKSTQIVDKLYNFYKEQIYLVSEGFKKQKQMLVSLNNAIENIFIKIQKFTETFCNYCQKVLKQNKFKLQKQKITIIFEKLSSKDEFLHLYEDNLINKIFSNQIDLKIQEEFIQYLNEICGNQVTHKLTKKIKDYSINQNDQYCRDIVQNVPKKINLRTKIISLHLWQKRFNDQLALNMNLAQPMNQIWRTIQQNYQRVEPKRKLILLPFQNKLILSIWFNTRKINFKCNILQACIFFYLSQQNRSLQENLISSLSVQKNMLQSILDTFFQLTPGLICKSQEGFYSINWNYWKAQTDIDIDSKIFESKKIIKAIQQDRQILLQAAIVKHMKKTRKSTFQELVEGLNKLIKLFRPQPHIIKASIQKLVKKGYIQQEELNLNETQTLKEEQQKSSTQSIQQIQGTKTEAVQRTNLENNVKSQQNSPHKQKSSTNINLSSKVFIYVE